MNYTTILTSKGTTTIPKEIRDALGIRPGMKVVFSRSKTGEYILEKAPTIDTLRQENQAWLHKRGIKTVADDDMNNARAIFHKKGLKW